MDGVRARVLEWRGVWRIEWWSDNDDDEEEEEVNMVMGFCCSVFCGWRLKEEEKVNGLGWGFREIFEENIGESRGYFCNSIKNYLAAKHILKAFYP